MAPRSWKRSLSTLFKKDVSIDVETPQPVSTPPPVETPPPVNTPPPVEMPQPVNTPPPLETPPPVEMLELLQTPQRNFELATKCLKHTQRMTSPCNIFTAFTLQINHEQCEYLVQKLHVAVQSAGLCLRFHPPEVTAECVESMKLLCRSAKEVEAFILSCCSDNWIQAAMELVCMSNLVSSLSFDLDFCTVLFGSIRNSRRELDELDILSKSEEEVTQSVLNDHQTLLSRFQETLLHSSRNSSDQEYQLANSLFTRLRHKLSRSTELSAWEIDYSSLRQVQRLGHGSAGMVRKSKWMGAEVAEKMFYGSNYPSFKNEVQILAGLAHPNIVPLLGYAVEEGRCSIVMELMDGDLLLLMEERLRQDPTCTYPFTIFEAVDKMLQTAQGMLYLHGKKVVHRDLKSHNILIKRRKDIDD